MLQACPPPPETKEAGPPDATAERLFQATLHVIAERGLKGATTRVIAQEAGVNEVTLFRRYGSKNELIRAAILHRAGALSQQGVHYTGHLQADLTHLTREYTHALQTVGPVVRVIVTEFPRHPELRGMLDGPQQLFMQIAALLTRYQQEGQLRPEPIGTLLPAFLGPLVLPYLLPEIVPLILGEHAPQLDPQAHVERFLQGRALKETV